MFKDTMYVPIIRSRDAELRGVENLAPHVLDALLPVVEFTKSRPAKKNVNGAVGKCVTRVSDIFGERPYIADVTTLSSLENAETERLLDHSGGFSNWCAFVASELPSQAVPVVHLTDPLNFEDLRLQVSKLVNKNGRVALRIPPGYPSAARVVALVAQHVLPQNIALIVDAGFVHLSKVSEVTASLKMTLAGIPAGLGMTCASSSGFPSSVVLPGFGGDAQGHFKLAEVEIAAALAELGLTYSDYALVHPNDFEGVVTNWVPRVDVPLDSTLFYHRYRRDDGGYERAASEALKDPNYKALLCWADANIRSTASGKPAGRSPAFWIGCRVNMHITRQVTRLAQRTLFGRVSM